VWQVHRDATEAAGKMHWTDAGTAKIQRANLDGTGVEDLVTGVLGPHGIALDVAGGKMYWTDGQTHKIQRANLDGTEVEELVTGLSSPFGIALDVGKQLTALSPAKVWVGLKNSDAVGLRIDLKAEVFVNSVTDPPIGRGHLDNLTSGSIGFVNARLNMIPLELADGPVTLADGDELLLRVSVRRTFSGSGHNSGTPRLWYNGEPVDSGATRDAGSRFDATIDGNNDDYYLRTGFALDTTAGASRTFIDKAVNSSVACPDRPFTPFGTWSITPQD
jgi:hypothetical protein